MLRTKATVLAGPPAKIRSLFARLFSSRWMPSFSIHTQPQHSDISPSSVLPEQSALYALKKLDKMPQRALDFFVHAKARSGFRPGAAAYNTMLRILGQSKDHIKDFWAVAKAMEDDGHTIDRATYSTLLYGFKRQKLSQDYSALAQFYSRSMEKAAMDSDIGSIVGVLLATENWDEETEKKLTDLNFIPTDEKLAKIIRGAHEKPSMALGFFRWVGKTSGCKPSTITYNAMLRVLGRAEILTEFWALIKEMKQNGCDIDIDTYIKLSRQFQKNKMMKEVVELYELMMDGPYKPAIQDCGLLLRQIALAGNPDLDLVFRVVKKYEDAGYSLSKVVYDGIHRSLTSIGKFEEAEEIMQKMKEAGYEPDNITYSQLVYGLCKATKLEEACKVLDKMKENGCVPDVKTWTVLIQGHCSAGAVDKALECLTNMIEKGCDADADLLDVLMRGLCSKKKVDGAYTLLLEMVERARVRPWQATYKYLITELLQVKKLEEALKLLSSMKGHHFPPFAEPFPPYISMFGTIEDAREFLKALTVSQYPSPTAYLNVFKSFFKEGRYSEAKDLLFKCPHHIRKHSDISKLFGSTNVDKND